MKILSLRARRVLLRQNHRVFSYYLGQFLIYLGCLIIALIMAWLVFKANRIYLTYRTTLQSLTKPEALVSEGQRDSFTSELAQLQESLQEVNRGLETLYEELLPFLPITPYL